MGIWMGAIDRNYLRVGDVFCGSILFPKHIRTYWHFLWISRYSVVPLDLKDRCLLGWDKYLTESRLTLCCNFKLESPRILEKIRQKTMRSYVFLAFMDPWNILKKSTLPGLLSFRVLENFFKEPTLSHLKKSIFLTFKKTW